MCDLLALNAELPTGVGANQRRRSALSWCRSRPNHGSTWGAYKKQTNNHLIRSTSCFAENPRMKSVCLLGVTIDVDAMILDLSGTSCLYIDCCIVGGAGCTLCSKRGDARGSARAPVDEWRWSRGGRMSKFLFQGMQATHHTELSNLRIQHKPLSPATRSQLIDQW